MKIHHYIRSIDLWGNQKKKEFDVHNMTPDEQLKFEIAQNWDWMRKCCKGLEKPYFQGKWPYWRYDHRTEETIKKRKH